jgi:chaperone modulatory protein CbpM
MIKEDKPVVVSGILIDEAWEKSLLELCRVCHTDIDVVIEMVDYGLLEPKGHSSEDWSFNVNDFRRLQKALRLHRDLEINLAGVALALDLMEELDLLRKKIRRLEVD